MGAKSRRAGTAALTGVAVACGCAGDTGSRGISAERDSAGITIVEVTGEAPQWQEPLDTVLRIGVVDGEPTQEFHRIAFAARLSDGGVVVADGGSNEVRWFDAAGAHERTFGRRGEGPGEFRELSEELLVAGDTLVVFDARNQRATWLAPAGEAVGELPFAGERRGHMIGASGHALTAYMSTTAPIDDQVSTRLTSTLTLIALERERQDTIVSIQGPDVGRIAFRFDAQGRPIATQSGELPFGTPPLLGWVGGAVLVAEADRAQLCYYDTNGKLTRVVRLLNEVTGEVTDEDRAKYVAHVVERASLAGGPYASTADEFARKSLDLLAPGRRKAAFDRLLVAADQLIWLRRYRPPWAAAESQRWLILEPDGRLAGSLALPESFRLMHAGHGHVTGLVKDELDVEYVLVLRLRGH